MAIAIVTDSTSDLPIAVCQALNIHVVPIYVSFGNKTFRDGIDLNNEEFYKQLLNSSELPKTSQPTIEDFKAIYNKLSKTAEGIISIHISSKLSGTYNSALQAKKQLPDKCPIEIIDSQQTSVGLGLITQVIAKAAIEENSIASLVELSYALIAKTDTYCLLNTLDFLVKGGRIGKAKGLIGSIINIKPILQIRGGEIHESTKTRSFAKGIETLLDIAEKHLPISEFAVAGNTNMEDVAWLVENLKSRLIFNKEIGVNQFGSALGTHLGPRALGITLIKA